MDRMFEKAIRTNLKFPSHKGLLLPQDVYNLPLTSENGTSLNSVAKAINRQIKDAGEEDFVDEPSPANASLNLSFEIIKHIIKVRKAENAAKIEEVSKRALLKKLREKRDQKVDAGFDDLSVEELDAKIAELT